MNNTPQEITSPGFTNYLTLGAFLPTRKKEN